MKNKGTSLIELMITIGLVGILCLAIASAFTFGANQFALLQESNAAQTNVQQAAFYLKLFLSNAIKVQCNPGGPIGNPVTLADASGLNPNLVPDGLIDCVGYAGNAWPSTQASALGIFFRENSAFTTTAAATSSYQGVGVYYQAPDGSDNNMGNLIFSTQSPGGGTVSSTANSFKIDHLSNIKIKSATTVPVLNSTGVTYNMLTSITYEITTRFISSRGIKNYAPTYLTSQILPGVGLANDVVQQVQIAFHDNYLGADLSDSANTAQRLNGGIYYFKFITPSFLY